MTVDDRGLFVVDPHRLPLLRPDAQTFEEMLHGFRNQQLARSLALKTVEQRERLVRIFVDHAGTYPWDWTLQSVDEFFADRRSVHHNLHTTIRSYQNALKLFCDYVCDPGYGWVERCLELFGTHPVRVINDWNTARHVQDVEHGGGRRAFTRGELQSLFDVADDDADRIARLGRKGWMTAFRDATVLKTAYMFGLRINEVRHLQTVDFTRNPYAPEFGKYGHLNVRFGKAMKGSGYKQRNVLAVLPWGSEILSEWVERSARFRGESLDLFPTERSTLVSEATLQSKFRRVRAEIGLGEEVTFHSLRRSYITHLIEDGFDALFVQQQVGHEYASTTAIYTGVSSDYRTSTLRAVLDGMMGDALQTTTGSS
ncbi:MULTISPECIES: tyrosine-type recombinase/integrase [unclassified Curtobacterium]|uniref:tyrosine-type recombinase/integrase n=1 Tax=unclassified Curtobacterium TaxID=257496 RepID=UPI000F88F50D|nr:MULTISPECIES: site-specific integrase [unclassified Curtobacterium]RUQ09850.1 site-specific integrase [Curtobacterium sp. HSID17257]